jgi:hypothetical protein
MRNIILPILLIVSVFHGNAQTEELPDFVVQNGDTTYCFISELVRAAGNVTKIEYTDLKGGKHVIEGKKDVKEVSSLRLGGYVVDYIPLNPKKPDGFKRHMERKVDGKIIIYDHIRLIASTDKKGKRTLYSIIGQGSAFYIIKIGKTYYDITKKNVYEEVEPVLMRCPAFKKGFTEEVKVKNIKQAVEYYNSACD